MQQKTSKQLYAYWDRARNGRAAPRRFEIEPAKIASILSETFIAECEGALTYRFRLAGTRICEQFGRELRGTDLLALWQPQDRHRCASLLRHVVTDAAAGHVLFDAIGEEGRRAQLELVVMPLVQAGTTINRLLGAITAIDPPFWLGTAPLLSLEVSEIALIWPDGERASTSPAGEATETTAEFANLIHGRFRVYQGGGH